MTPATRTPAVAEKRKKAFEFFRANPKRPAAFAGASYPGEALLLAGELTGFFTAENGPGKEPPLAPSKAAPLGLIAPHIDFTRGGPAYAWAYQALSERKAPDIVIALGVAHASPDSPWVFTPKSYETPFGPMEVDDELYHKLSSRVWYEPRADEWVHKNEHSLEFQAVWLKHLWREKAPKWIPILVSSFERFSPDEAPAKVPTIEKALKDLGDVLKAEIARGRTVTIVCGIDLAHVGLRFGDELEITPELEKKIEAEDRRSLVAAMALDADGFYKSVVADEHWRKVCGLSALYTGLRLMKMIGAVQPGRLLAYGQAPDPRAGLSRLRDLRRVGLETARRRDHALGRADPTPGSSATYKEPLSRRPQAPSGTIPPPGLIARRSIAAVSTHSHAQLSGRR